MTYKKRFGFVGDKCWLELTQGQVAWVDSEDFELVSQYNWYGIWQPTLNGFYAVTHIFHPTQSGKQTLLFMHRLVLELEPSDGLISDHINRFTLDNRRNNLRATNREGNGGNIKKRSNNTSGYMGVSFYKRTNKWRTQIKKNGSVTHIGFFDDPEEAAQAYDQAVIDFRDEYATTNFSRETYEEETV